MLRPDAIDAVVFDMGGVFVIPSPYAINEMVASAGLMLDLDDAAARLGHYSGIRAITELMAHQDVVESHRSSWDAYDEAYFGSAGLDGDDLGVAMEARSAHRVTGDVADVWSHLLDENFEGFRRIAAGRPVAIVTNNNGTAVEQCARAELCQVGPGPHTEVAAIVDSTIMEISKPDPRIFAPAVEALGTDPARTLYVGDTVHADVRGAEAAGMAVVQLDPFDLHADHSHWRLADAAVLADHLS